MDIEVVKNIINNFLSLHMLTTGIINENNELYRGESEHYQEVSSKLWRKYRPCANHHNFNIQAVQDEMVNEAKKHDVTLTKSYITLSRIHFENNFQTTADAVNAMREAERKHQDIEILSKIQHYGGSTNLIDFTRDFLIAFYFACQGSPNKNGRIIIIKKTDGTIKRWIKETGHPEQRITAQKSIFIDPPRGTIPKRLYRQYTIPGKYKTDILEYLQRYHNIRLETVYNDLHGFIQIQDKSLMNQMDIFHKGLVYQNKAEKTNKAKKQKLYNKALRYYEIAIQLQKERSINHEQTPYKFAEFQCKVNNQIGMIYYNQGKIEEAEEKFKETIGYYNQTTKESTDRTTLHDLSEAYRNIGLINYSKDDIKTAICNYNKAIEEYSDNFQAYQNRADAYNKLGETDKAKQDITEVNRITEILELNKHRFPDTKRPGRQKQEQ